MSLLVNRLQEEEEQHQTLVYHTTVLLDECGVTAKEGTMMCFDGRFCRRGPVLVLGGC